MFDVSNKVGKSKICIEFDNMSLSNEVVKNICAKIKAL